MLKLKIFRGQFYPIDINGKSTKQQIKNTKIKIFNKSTSFDH